MNDDTQYAIFGDRPSTSRNPAKRGSDATPVTMRVLLSLCASEAWIHGGCDAQREAFQSQSERGWERESGKQSYRDQESFRFVEQSVMRKGCKKEQVWQCYGFCTADLLYWLLYESVVQKPKHCLTSSFLHSLVMRQGRDSIQSNKSFKTEEGTHNVSGFLSPHYLPRPFFRLLE